MLWEADHTLIDNGGVSRGNYALAFELLTGRPAIQTARADGPTDVVIMAHLRLEIPGFIAWRWTYLEVARDGGGRSDQGRTRCVSRRASCFQSGECGFQIAHQLP